MHRDPQLNPYLTYIHLQSTSIIFSICTDGAGCGEVAAQRARACTRRACVRRPDGVRTGCSARRLRPIALRDALADLPAACARRAILRQPEQNLWVPFLANALDPDGGPDICALRALR